MELTIVLNCGEIGMTLNGHSGRSMYVCICHGVTDHQIRRAADEGVRDVHELTMRTGAGSNCGSCLEQAQQILDEQRKPVVLDLPVLRAA
jgi:bacterioferritin-associated ferredoxin